MHSVTTRHIVRSGFIVLIGTIIAHALHYSFNIFMTRSLAPSDYAILITIISIFSIIAVPLRTATTVAAKHTSFITNGYKQYLLATLLLGVGITGMYLFLIPLIASSLAVPWQALLSISPIIVLTPSLCMNMGILQGLRKVHLFSSIPVLEGALKGGCAILFLALGYALMGALASISLTVVTSWVITSVYLGKNYWRTANSSSHIPDEWKSNAVTIFISTMAMALLGNMDIIAAKYFLDTDAAASYSALAVISRTISYGSLIMIPILFPAMSQAQSINQSRTIFRKGLIISTSAAAIILLAFAIYPDQIITLLVGTYYIDIAPYILAAGAVITLWSLSQIFLSYFIASNSKGFLAPLVCITALEALGLVMFHTSILAIILTTLATETSLLVMFIALFIHKRRHA